MENKYQKLLTDALNQINYLESKLSASSTMNQEPIAIVGGACRFPGGVINLLSFWELLKSGHDTVMTVPKERWPVNSFYDVEQGVRGKSYTDKGCFIENIDMFDADFFKISDKEAVVMDPQQRLLLECAYEALENSGLVVNKLKGSKTGVFIGLMNQEYRDRIADPANLDIYYGTGNAASIASNRISYVLGLQGPSVTIDTACSSSLVSVHLACQSLMMRESNIALAGGVNLQLSPYSSIAMSAADMLSKKGQCRPFDNEADGFVRGDGAGIVVLTRLSDAMKMNHPILAIILGSAVNHDGIRGGLTVPNGPSQSKVIQDALINARVNPGELSYIETHGTGTALGDPIELGALEMVFKNSHSIENPLFVGSIKSQIGHSESAAGIAGLLKVVLMLLHEQILPQSHFNIPNVKIPWQEIPIVVNTELRSWRKNSRKLAGVSSFGLGGTNAHVILGQASPQKNHSIFKNNKTYFSRKRYWLDFKCADGFSEEEMLVAKIKWKNEEISKNTISDDLGNIVTFIKDNKIESLKKTWIIFSDKDGIGKRLHQILIQFSEVYLVFPGENFEKLSKNVFIANISDQYSMSQLFETFKFKEFLSILYLPTMDYHLLNFEELNSNSLETWRNQLYDCQVSSVLNLIHTIRPFINNENQFPSLRTLWVLTRQVYAVDSHPIPINISLGSMPGFIHVIQDENPELKICHLDLDLCEPDAVIKILMNEFIYNTNNNQISYRSGLRYCPKIIKVTLTPSSLNSNPLQFKQEATYVISGGLGGLGLSVAEWLQKKGAKNVVLLSRKGIEQKSKGVQEAVNKLAQSGINLTIVEVDISDLQALNASFSKIEQEMPPIAGIFHSAGILEDATILNQNEERLNKVFSPKILGALNLHIVTLKRALDFLVLFSSIAAILPAPGQGNYAAANSFLEFFSQYRNQQNLKTFCIHWGPWENLGMSISSAKVVDNLSRNQMHTLKPEQALNALEFLMQKSPVPAIVLHNLSKLQTKLLFSNVSYKDNEDGEKIFDYDALIHLNSFEREQIIRALILDCFRTVKPKLTANELADDQTFEQLGLDSLMAIEIRNDIARRLRKALPVGLVYNYPTLAQLTKFLASLWQTSQDSDKKILSLMKEPINEPIAVVALSCRFPGGAETPEIFWENLINGKDCIQDMGNKRWIMDQYNDGGSDTIHQISSRLAGLVDNIEDFDCLYFGITPREALYMDPQQRLLLEVSVEALARAGYVANKMQGVLGGIFIGTCPNEYVQLCRNYGLGLDPYMGTGNHNSVSGGRLAFYLGWQGPCLTIDTACSSSLVSVHLACQSLRNQECDIALAGGVNVILLPETSVVLSKAQMLSKEGYCKTFDAKADGYVRSEGCGMVVLKRLSDAQKNKDPILAVIRGSAVNQDGRSQGLTAPNGPAQELVIQKALENANLNASEIDYVEAHGTGTLLGDPIEMQVLDAIYGSSHHPSKPLWVGSVKTNIGHAESASGIAGLIKTILSLKNRNIPSHLHLNKLNPHLGMKENMNENRIQIPCVTTPWPTSKNKSRAAVSSFGFSGTNCHMILEQYAEEIVEIGFKQDKAALVSFKKLRFWPNRPVQELKNNNAIHSIGDTLGQKVFLANNNWVFINHYSRNFPYCFQDHQLGGKIIIPGAAHISTLIESYRHIHKISKTTNSKENIFYVQLKDIVFIEPMILEYQSNVFQLIVSEPAQHYRIAKGYSRELETKVLWNPLVEAKLVALDTEINQFKVMDTISEIDVHNIFNFYENKTSGAEFYQTMHQGGYGLGPSFQWIKVLYYTDKESIAILCGREEDPSFNSEYYLPPGLIDSFFQTIAAAKENKSEVAVSDKLFIPFSVEHFEIVAEPKGSLICRAEFVGSNESTYIHNITVYNNQGVPIIIIKNLVSKLFDRDNNKLEMRNIIKGVEKTQEGSEPLNKLNSITTDKLSEKLAGLPLFDQREIISVLIKNVITKALMLEDIEPEKSLFELGVDSLLTVELRDEINEVTGQKFETTLIFKYPTLKSLVDLVLEKTIVHSNHFGSGKKYESYQSTHEIQEIHATVEESLANILEDLLNKEDNSDAQNTIDSNSNIKKKEHSYE